jgi:hypothetical protein
MDVFYFWIDMEEDEMATKRTPTRTTVILKNGAAPAHIIGRKVVQGQKKG